MSAHPQDAIRYTRTPVARQYTEAMKSSASSSLPSRSVARPAFLALVLLLGTGSAFAQWQWIDGRGQRVFSDTPPPAGTPDKNILKRPGGRAMAPPSPTETPDAPPTQAAAAPATPRPATQDTELEARKKQAEQAEAAKRKAEQEKFVKSRAENCERAKRAKTTLDSGIRVATTNAKGEREIMDDAARASESRRIDEIIKSDCGPLPASDATVAR